MFKESLFQKYSHKAQFSFNLWQLIKQLLTLVLQRTRTAALSPTQKCVLEVQGNIFAFIVTDIQRPRIREAKCSAVCGILTIKIVPHQMLCPSPETLPRSSTKRNVHASQRTFSFFPLPPPSFFPTSVPTSPSLFSFFFCSRFTVLGNRKNEQCLFLCD